MTATAKSAFQPSNIFLLPDGGGVRIFHKLKIRDKGKWGLAYVRVWHILYGMQVFLER